MHLNKPFEVVNRKLIYEVMQRYPLAMLISQSEGDDLFMTHIPLIALDNDGEWVLEGHVASVNPQSNSLCEKASVTVVFNGPHAYISPKHYDSKLAVPTWNYIAIYAKGLLEIVKEPFEKDALLKRLIHKHDPTYANQWRTLPMDYQNKMLNGIVAFKIRITHLDAKFKLSQNRSSVDHLSVYNALVKGRALEKELAFWLKRVGEIE